jgi:hypothetical protein
MQAEIFAKHFWFQDCGEVAGQIDKGVTVKKELENFNEACEKSIVNTADMLDSVL